ncbi:hypothetical protein AAMO2058_001140500 [Amorphochlora amoebiformis]|mmetsp:Transcript_28787/g.45980  ORF Transcript_28787/g.45980 Transcript_28787/m.45980 type:complete len:274 (-) Transcript_28787:131-952(-)
MLARPLSVLSRPHFPYQTLSRALSTRTPIVGGNWKLNAGNGTTKDTIDELVKGLNDGKAPACEVFVCPPTLYLERVQTTVVSYINVCSQNIYCKTKGAFTGETSAEMLMDMGIGYTLIGHSERRDIFGETDYLLGEKIAHAQSVGMNVVACIGEHKEDRVSGKTMDVLIPQLTAIKDNVSDWSSVVIAYEPVWAIGTGLTATPEQAQETHANIRTWLSQNISAEVADSIRIQYGGSVNDKNSEDLASGADIDGFLVGGASLKAPSFHSICSVF